MRGIYATLALVGLLTACAGESTTQTEAREGATSKRANRANTTADLKLQNSRIARLPDEGRLVAYDQSAPILQQGSTWHAVQLSEDHALRSLVTGEMSLVSPSGDMVRLAYQRHVEHADGNWTWLGQSADGQGVTLTFGEKAVFGSIPLGSERTMQLATAGGRTWLVEADMKALRSPGDDGGRLADSILTPTELQGGSLAAATLRASGAPVRPASAAVATASTTVDLVLGYTDGYAVRLGGSSQAVTRLHFLVDIANRALVDSNVDGEIRLVHTVQVSYPDATSNRSALFQLTGVTCTTSNSGSVRIPDEGLNCSTATPPESLQPLLAARDRYGADLVSLVRTFQSPENGSCGLAWLVGAAQSAISSSNAGFGFSVVSDSSGNQFPDEGNVCREDYLAHELGHNMGLQHDRTSAAGSDDTDGDSNLLDPEEFGAFPYSFGHSTGSADGNFYTVMSIRRAGQSGFRVFSNPRITSCGGRPCGVADQADNARALGLTMPIVATFRSSLVATGGNWLRGDFDADGRADVLWRNNGTGANVIWRAANGAMPMGVTSVPNLAWDVVGVGDFNADGRSDILWRNSVSGANTIWRSASSASQLYVATVPNLAWRVVGVGDFDGDGRSDIFWRNSISGANTIWRAGNASTQQYVTSVPNLDWSIVGVGDFNNDGRADVLWRNATTGVNLIWRSANALTQQYVTSVPNTAWAVAGVGDFNGDGTADILWRNGSTGANVIWRSGNSSVIQYVSTVPNIAWSIKGVGDFDNDGRDDILWRNSSTGVNTIWRSGNSATQQPMTSVPNLSWIIAG